MKQRLLIGILLALISVFSSCEKTIIPDTNLEWIELGIGETKGTQSFNWMRNDQICVYSLDGNENITYKYVATVTNASGNTGKIKALVDKNANQYFASYPANAINCEVNEFLNKDNLNVIYNGKYRDVSIMTTYVPKTSQDIWFEQRLSLLKITNYLGSVNGNVVIESSLPKQIDFKMNSFSDYYVPLTYKSESIKITFKTDNYTRTKTLIAEPGHIYVSEWTIN